MTCDQWGALASRGDLAGTKPPPQRRCTKRVRWRRTVGSRTASREVTTPWRHTGRARLPETKRRIWRDSPRWVGVGCGAPLPGYRAGTADAPPSAASLAGRDRVLVPLLTHARALPAVLDCHDTLSLAPSLPRPSTPHGCRDAVLSPGSGRAYGHLQRVLAPPQSRRIATEPQPRAVARAHIPTTELR